MTTGRINQVTIRVHVDRTAPLRTGRPLPEGRRSRFTKDVTARALLQSLAHRPPTEWLRRAVPVDATRVESTVRRVDDATPISPVAPCETVQPKSRSRFGAENPTAVGPDADPNAVPAHKPGNAKPEPYTKQPHLAPRTKAQQEASHSSYRVSSAAQTN